MKTQKQMQSIKTIGLFGALCLAIFMAGQLRAEGPNVSGFIDTTYNYNFNKPFTQNTALRSYDAKANNFALNSAHLEFAGTMEDAGYNIQIDAGSDAAINKGAAHSTDNFDVQEAYLTYTCPSSKVNFKAGKFVTFNGIEVIESKDNPTISRGYLFGLAEPYTHVGAMAGKAFGKVDFMLGVLNGWDLTTDNNNSKTLMGKIGFNFGDSLAFAISGHHGSEQSNAGHAASTSTAKNDGNNRSTIDLTGVTKIIPKVALFFQYNYGQEEKLLDVLGSTKTATWNGFGIQPVFTITDKFSIGTRGEYFYDPQGVRTASGHNNISVSNFTITPSYKCTANTTMRAEYRYDTSNKKIWVDDKGILKDSASTVSAEFIVTF